MATLLMKQKQCAVKDKSKQAKTKRTQTKQQEHEQQQHHHHHYYYGHHKQSKEIVEDDNCNKDVDDFYHIKPYYHQTTTIITTKSSTLNQRTNFIRKNTSTTPITTTTGAPNTPLSNVLHSLSYNGRSFVTLLLLGYLLLVQYAMAAPQSCILCDKNDLLAKDPHTNFEEFLFEHQVTRQDAINALRQLNDSFYEGSASDSSCNGVRCTEKVMKYCLGPQFINDHCWCEVGHSTEGLPFVPHICYVGEKIYKTSVGSCFFYEEVKDCCCSSLLAKEWRHISAGASVYSKTMFHSNYVTVVIFLLCLLFRRCYN